MNNEKTFGDPKPIKKLTQKIYRIPPIAANKKKCAICRKHISKRLTECPNCQLKNANKDQFKKAIKKITKSPYQVAEDSTWQIFSRCIRLRDTDEQGFGYCVATGKRIWYRIENGQVISNCDAGHFVSRRIKSIIFDERNVNAQGRQSNRFDEGQKHLQRTRLIKKYSEEDVLHLEQKEALWKSSKQGKYSITELKAMRKRFRGWEKELLAKKHF